MKYVSMLTLPLLLVLSGCAGKAMNENQCLVADWRTAGFEDGSMGRNEQWLGRRAEACAEYGVTPDMDQYLMGRAQGLESYCEPRRAFDLGVRGGRYNNVCPAHLADPFQNALQDGRGLRERRYELGQIENALNSAHTTIQALDNDIIANTLTLATAPEMTNQARIDYALSIKNMAEQRGGLAASIPQMEADLQAARYDLDAFTASIAPKYPGAI